MRNKIEDLNNHLFAQLEKISEADLTGEELKQEVSRSKAISDLSKNILESAKLTVEVAKMLNDEEPSKATLVLNTIVNPKNVISNE